MGQLDGKVAVITGGGAGIGVAIAKYFFQQGAHLCILDISEQNLERISQEIDTSVLTVHGDVSRYEDNARAIELAVKTFGKIDVFVGNAGIFDGHTELRSLTPGMIDTGFDEIFKVNVKGILFGAKASFEELEKTRGTMIFSISNAGFYPAGAGPIYTASKHAIVGLIRELAFELAPRVRVNGVAPGGTATQLKVAPSFALSNTNARVGDPELLQKNPLRIRMFPDDHAAAYAFLASEQSKTMTGVVIHSDGGLGVRGI